MSKTQNIGNLGEQIACDYLLDLGYVILHRNYRIGHLELDIIAERENTLYFIEVKTRSCSDESVDEFMPEAAFTKTKKERIARAAESFLSQNNHTGEVFLELIAINLSESNRKIRHYPAIQW